MLHLDFAPVSAGKRDRGPVDVEQRFARDSGVVGGSRTGDERVDRDDRGAVGVRRGDRERLALGPDAHAQRGRTGRVQRDSLPRKGHASVGRAQVGGVQGGVQQGRVQAVAVGLRPRRRPRRRRRHRARQAARRPLERRPVGEAVVREPLVEPFQRNRFRTRRRPDGRIEVGAGGAVGEETGAVLEPRRVRVEPRVHGDGAACPCCPARRPRPGAAPGRRAPAAPTGSVRPGGPDPAHRPRATRARRTRCRETAIRPPTTWSASHGWVAIESLLVNRTPCPLGQLHLRAEQRVADGGEAEPGARRRSSRSTARNAGAGTRTSAGRSLVAPS